MNSIPERSEITVECDEGFFKLAAFWTSMRVSLPAFKRDPSERESIAKESFPVIREVPSWSFMPMVAAFPGVSDPVSTRTSPFKKRISPAVSALARERVGAAKINKKYFKHSFFIPPLYHRGGIGLGAISTRVRPEAEWYLRFVIVGEIR